MAPALLSTAAHLIKISKATNQIGGFCVCNFFSPRKYNMKNLGV
jgi:hypothetical protein